MPVALSTQHPPSAGLASKLLAIGCVCLVLALASIGLTLWVTWQLEGGAAAVNEAGRMRMRTYQLALSLQRSAAAPGQFAADIAMRLKDFDNSLALLRTGDPARPLSVPWDEATRSRFHGLNEEWRVLRQQALDIAQGAPIPPTLGANVESLVTHIDTFVTAIERHVADWTALLHAFQLAMMALAVLSALATLYAGHVLVLAPVVRLKRALLQITQGNFSTRVTVNTRDELGELADGFNSMAKNLESLYGQLEAKVQEKTAGLEIKQARLGALYEGAAFAARADTLDELARGFATQMRRMARADAVAIRWFDETKEGHVLLANEGEQAGNHSLVAVPMGLHQRVLGEVALFFKAAPQFNDEERGLFEALASHLAGAVESLRAATLDRESAVSGERQLLAQELHDSIAQSLAFLKIQMQLLRDAMAHGDTEGIETSMSELDLGLRVSYSDVRELLLHFRVRTREQDIEPALRETLSKLERQAGLRSQLSLQAPGLLLPTEVQIQVLHIVQEALTNVRKHAHANQVWVDVQTQPTWCISVHDDGCGFDVHASPPDDTHVGLRIMCERAERIGGVLQFESGPQGSHIELRLPHLATMPAPSS